MSAPLSDRIAGLRAGAETAAAGLPALVPSAERLAAMIAPGAHGLRRGGPGEDFWQYRPAAPGDPARAIDWRRSARSDAQFVRDREAQTAQAVAVWVAGGASMHWSGSPSRPQKIDRARLLALALALALLRGGEKVGPYGAPARAGRAQGDRIAEALLAAPPASQASQDGDAPDPAALRPGQRLVLLGDFLSDPAPLLALVGRAAAMGLRGAMMQVLDPDEEVFPYHGAVVFRALSGRVSHDTRDAEGLRPAYLARLAERRDLLRQACDAAGWHFGTHDSGAAPAQALMWLYQVLEG